MSALNFGKLADTQAVAGSKRLKPWEIHKVKFMGCKVEEIQGKKDPNATYKILVTRFENETGYFEERTFFPNEESAKRPTFTNREGHEYEGASNFEQIMAFIAQLGTVLNPEGFKKMQAASSKFKTFDDVCKALITITTPSKGKEYFLKIVGKTDKEGRVSPALPRIVGVNKEGEVFTSDNFISAKFEILGFSDYEEQKRKEAQNAKPTNMGRVDDAPAAPSEEAEEEINDFEGLL